MFLVNSKCATEVKERLYLNELLGNKRLVTVMLYRGSDHGWMYKDFHYWCDRRGPTISLFKVKGGDCIGGYTTA
jgi:TLD